MNGTSGAAWAEATTRALSHLKDVPLWVLLGISIASGGSIILFGSDFSRATFVGISCIALLFVALTITRILALTVVGVRAWLAARDEARILHVTVQGRSRWHLARQPDDTYLTQISIDALVKNRTDEPLSLVRATAVKPKILRGEVVSGFISIEGEDGCIPPRKSRSVHIHMMVRARPNWAPDTVVSAVFAISDDEGRERRFPVILRNSGGKAAPPKKPPEQVFAIQDPNERAVVSVLQLELKRYEANGRRTGGLGSVTFKPYGPERCDTSMPRGAQPMALSSDNLDTLIALRGRLDETERGALLQQLLARLDAHEDYLSISYFIVLALIKFGHLHDALEHAGRLPADDRKLFGLSNTLMLLDKLLRHAYGDFSDSDLDEIERFVHSTEEHPFQILELIAAIRASRVLNPS